MEYKYHRSERAARFCHKTYHHRTPEDKMMTEQLFFERIRKHLSDALPFVVYRKPDEERVVAYFQADDKINLVSNSTESGFIFAPFLQNRNAILIPFADKIECELYLPEVTASETSHPRASLASKEHHESLVQKGIDAIKNSALEKVVLSRKQSVGLNDPDPIEIYRKLLASYPSAFCYLWFHPKIGLWTGATPEVLLTVERKRFKTMALAATQKFQGSVDIDWGEKELEEQQIVTRTIVSALKKLGISSLEVSEVHTHQAGNLLHLKTDIQGLLPVAITLSQMLSELHPTPAVCGLPLAMAQDFILEHEGYDREFYTGYLGELNLKEHIQRYRSKRNVEQRAYRTPKQSSSLYVNLRCMKLEGDTAHIFVGGGITKDSTATDEWIETVNKSQTMLKVL
ncbi:chorismate-binding protein [Sungkyunkwania multivorans]|uniref:Chorismate-binding protein n=1 Tax=Sungkyunkwania multivorans TaxID=1173618 RepID=A0ABW3CZW5_9FLAO